MIQPVSDEEFYNAVLKNTERVYNMSIPLMEKDKLYQIIYESVKRHKINKETRASIEDSSIKIKNGLAELSSNLGSIINLIGSIEKGLVSIVEADVQIQKHAKNLHLNN